MLKNTFLCIGILTITKSQKNFDFTLLWPQSNTFGDSKKLYIIIAFHELVSRYTDTLYYCLQVSWAE